MKNPWGQYNAGSELGFHPLDADVCNRFNSGKKKPIPSQFQLRPDYSPLPFFGNPNEARFAILMANPGLDEVSTKIEETPDRQRLFDQARRHQLKDNPFVFLRPEFEGTPGYDWWQKRTRVLRDEIGDDTFANFTFSAEIHPYKSVKYRPLKEDLPTFEYTRELIRGLMQTDAAVLIRSAGWFDVMPELKTYRRVYQMKNPILSYITPKTVANNGFGEILRAYSER